MEFKVQRAKKTLQALGYRVWMSESGHTLNARRGQSHIKIAFPSGNISAHKDMPGSGTHIHRALRGPFTHELIKEFRQAYRRSVAA